MGETDYKAPDWTEEDVADMRRVTDEGRRKDPFYPTTIRGLAYEIVTHKHDDLSESAKEFLDVSGLSPGASAGDSSSE